MPKPESRKNRIAFPAAVSALACLGPAAWAQEANPANPKVPVLTPPRAVHGPPPGRLAPISFQLPAGSTPSAPDSKPPTAAPVPPPNPPAATANPNAVVAPPPLTPPGTPLPQTTTAETPPGLPSPDGALPPVKPGDEEIQSGQQRPGGKYSLESPAGIVYDMARGLALARGPVTFGYQDFTVKGDRGLVDYNTNRATLTGNLTITVRGQTFRGGALVFDLDTGLWRLTKIEAEFGPEYFPPGSVLEPILIRDGQAVGSNDTIRGEQLRVTTCDREHYYLLSKRLEFYRTADGRPERIVARRNSLVVLGQKILPLPVYVVSLLGDRTGRQPLNTIVGQNSIDGYFAKTTFDMRANERLTDSALVDLLEKRGLGLGLQRQWAAGSGLLYLYGVTGRQNGREVNSQVNRTFRLLPGINGNIQYQSTQNNSLTGEGISSSTSQLSIFRNGTKAQTTAILSTNQSSFGFGETSTGTIQLQHRQDFGSGFKIETSSYLTQTKNSNSPEQATSDQSLTLTKNSRLFDIFLRTELHDNLSEGTTSQLERLPELTLQSTTDRLKIPGLADWLPGDFTLGYGRFNEPSSRDSGVQLSRADFFYTVRQRPFQLAGSGKSTSLLRVGGNFEQAFYTDDSARYNYSYNLGWENKLGPIGTQLNYNKLRTYGFTPFAFDFTTPGEYLDATFFYEPSKKLRFNLTGGRDIQNSFTRDLVAGLQLRPMENVYTSLGTSFAPEGSKFGDVYGNLRFSRPRRSFLGGDVALGVRYNPNGMGLSRINSSFDVQLGPKTRFQVYSGYNGFSKTFDFSQIRVTRDLHCFNLYATYDGQRQELRFDIALKAFPFADSRLGQNQFSESFDPSVGDVR